MTLVMRSWHFVKNTMTHLLNLTKSATFAEEQQKQIDNEKSLFSL